MSAQEPTTDLLARLAQLEREVARERERSRDLRRRVELATDEHRTFLMLVAHQLRGPMLPLLLSLQAIQRAEEAGRTLPPDTIPRAIRQVHRLTRLIDSLLVDLPQLDAGSLTVQARVFDLRALLLSTCADFQRLFEARAFRVTTPDQPVEVLCDPERTAQVVSSLLENAIKYSPPEQPIEVTLSLSDVEARISVTDRGIGIPSAEQLQVFTKFFRGSNAPSYLYKGLGVGLYLARGLIEACHGRIWFESSGEQGTTFHVALPIRRDDVRDEA